MGYIGAISYPIYTPLILTFNGTSKWGPSPTRFAARTARLGLHNGGINAVRISTDGHTVRVHSNSCIQGGLPTSHKWNYIIPVRRVISSQLPIYKVLIRFQRITSWCFQIFFILTPGEDFPIWLLFFRWVETTNQIIRMMTPKTCLFFVKMSGAIVSGFTGCFFGGEGAS